MGTKQPPKQLTPEQLEKINDEHTVFALAVLAMDIHTGTLTRNKVLVANSFLKMNVVLQNNPGFPQRFRAAQDAIKKHLHQATATKLVVPDKLENAIDEALEKHLPPPPDSL